MSPEPRTEWVPCGGSPHGATWVGLLDSGAACGRPLGLRGPQGGAVSYQLLRGWQPQNEMFFIWKKWLQCWN